MAESGVKRNIPIKLGDFSVIDSEFSNIRERFDAEMRKMEDEMARFRSELMNRESNFFKSTTSSRHSHTTETKSSWKEGTDLPPTRGDFPGFSSQFKSTTTSSAHDANRGGEVRGWLEGLNSPLIQEDGEKKLLKLRYDLSQYKPEEIVVKTVDNKLFIHAKHEEKTDSKSVYREYNREFMLPSGTNPEAIRSSLSKDGVLTVEAPLPAIAGEKLIPIQQ
ncbi:protein lethal(2)essential for life isoform X1 [Anabrus simplex]|uniref:protein lethal(2)essential for life isoform X1 n=1 Tax=Anabrus simplex TaxID=316456 RepID=UPI0034DD2951